VTSQTTEMEAERRQLSVLFCDLVGSTALAARLDPEELRDVTAAYHAACDEVVARHDGHVAQYLGDGVLVYFGYPAAHEDDAPRAVRAGLGIVAALGPLNDRLDDRHGLRLSVRVGVHTGPVVVGEVGGERRREHLAQGQTPNVAARIQDAAAPGTVVVSEDTWRIARDFFEWKPLGSRPLKGLATPMALYHVVGELESESRIDASRRSGLTPLAGRAAELAVLDARWAEAVGGDGRAVLISGEAGIGKSRILDALRERVGGSAALALECRCSPYLSATPLAPVVEQIARVLGFRATTSDEERRASLRARLELRGILSEETETLMGELLGIPPAGGVDPLASYAPAKRRQRSLEVLLQWVLAATRDGPLLLAVEDLHWADPTTLEFVGELIRSLPRNRLMLVLTHRPEFPAPWPVGGGVSDMVLDRLGDDDTTAIVARVARGKAIPAAVLDTILARTEGVPLFVEEVTKAVLELGVLTEREDRYELAGPLPADLIPTTVQGSLAARLDRLGPAKGTAQVAATIGREFSWALLRAVTGEDDPQLRERLDRLLGAELVYRSDDAQDETYLFKHALIQDAAYQSLLKKSRRDLHRRIADVITSRFPTTAAQRPELVAQHLTGAGAAPDAFAAWLGAGAHAVARAAHHEAIAHLARARELIAELPEAEREERELEVTAAMMPALISTTGWASAELARAYERALDLLGRLPDTPHRFIILSGVMGWHFVSGRITEALAVSRQVLALAEQLGDPLCITIGRQDMCASHWLCGDLREAIEHGDAGLAMLDVDRERAIGRAIGIASCVGMLAYQISCWWAMGFPERASAAGARCLALAREIGQPPTILFATVAAMVEAWHRDDPEQVLERYADVMRLAHEERIVVWDGLADVYRGWALARTGRREEGARAVRDGIAHCRRMGKLSQLTEFCAIYAEVARAAGWRDEAYAAVADGMRHARENGEAFMESELFRLRASFRFADGVPGAEADARGAVERARRQGARMLELRALLTRCDIEDAARDAEAQAAATAELRACYDRFTEGFERPELRAAAARLASATRVP